MTPHRFTLFLIAVLGSLTATACGDNDRADSPELDEITRVVIVGDNAAGSPTVATSYASLLARNDDALFPAFAGKDLATRLPAAAIISMGLGADSYHALGSLASPLCLCDDACAATRVCLESGSAAPTLVILQLGAYDIFDIFIQIIFNATPADELVEGLRADAELVLATLNDPAVFPVRPLIIVVDATDPSDGVGDIAEIARAFYPTLPDIEISAADVAQVIEGFSRALADEADAAGARFVSAREHFNGHGYHAPAADLWLQNLLDPNPRGAHEMRRLLWTAITGETIDVAPGPLPPGDDGVLPVVPEPQGWANEVVSAALTTSFIDATGSEWTNVADDAADALGPPDNTADGSTALGIVGASLVLDLGEGEEAFDGAGADLVVIEFGAAAGGAPEPYRVSVSDVPNGPFVPLADGRGERGFDLAGTGLSMVRYVRLESAAHIVDVVSGFGSAFYPGPEIDAVGAVYPGGAGL